MKRHFDVVIVGGGVIGSAIAYFLRTMDVDSIAVIERDPRYTSASSALSASSIRQQFSTALNVTISQFGFEFLANISEHLAVDEPVDVGLVERGYLILAGTGNGAALAENVNLQRDCGAHIELFDQGQLRDIYPWLNSDDLDAAAYGASGEGWFDGYAVLQAFRRKARALGVEYVTAEVSSVQATDSTVDVVKCSDGSTFTADTFVNAAGPWAAGLCRMLGFELPVSARKRDVFVFDCPEPPQAVPMVFDLSGTWFRPEGKGFICGKAPDPDDDPPDVPLENVDHARFDEVLWPILAHRVPVFEAVRCTSAWAGYYAVNEFDHNAILGSAPGYSNFILANGFSGHGLQQAPAVGRGIAELITGGRYSSLDLSPFDFGRIASNTPIEEHTVY